MALPVEHEALQQIGPAQERRILRRRAADHDMIAAAGAGVAAVDQKSVGAEPDLCGVFIQAEGDVDGLAPALRRLDVDLDHAGIGRHLDDLDARIVRRRDSPRHAPAICSLLGGRLHRRDQFEIVLQLLDRRHEDAEHAVADLDRRSPCAPASASARAVRFLRSGVRGSPLLQRRVSFGPASVPARLHRILLDDVGIVSSAGYAAAKTAAAAADGESPGIRNRSAAPQFPALALPARRVVACASSAGSAARIPLALSRPRVEHPRHARALFGIGQLGIAGIDVRPASAASFCSQCAGSS